MTVIGNYVTEHNTANLPLHYRTINIIMHNTCCYVHHSETSYIRADKVHNYELYSKGTTMYTLSFLTTWQKLYKHLVYTTREIVSDRNKRDTRMASCTPHSNRMSKPHSTRMFHVPRHSCNPLSGMLVIEIGHSNTFSKE